MNINPSCTLKSGRLGCPHESWKFTHFYCWIFIRGWVASTCVKYFVGWRYQCPQSRMCNKTLHIVTWQTRTSCLSKVQFQELDRLLLLCQLAHLGVLNTGIFGPCLVAALWTGGLLETPPPWHVTIYFNSMWVIFSVLFHWTNTRWVTKHIFFYLRNNGQGMAYKTPNDLGSWPWSTGHS